MYYIIFIEVGHASDGDSKHVFVWGLRGFILKSESVLDHMREPEHTVYVAITSILYSLSVLTVNYITKQTYGHILQYTYVFHGI